MKIKLDMKPLSINACFQGRRYKTPLAKVYDTELQLRLPKQKIDAEFYEISYKFYLKSKIFLMGDTDNYIKQIQDNLVKKGIIKDDRFIKKITAEKFMADDYRIEIEIKDYK